MYMKTKCSIEKIIYNIKDAEKRAKTDKVDLSIKNKLLAYLVKVNKIGSKYEMVYRYFEPKEHRKVNTKKKLKQSKSKTSLNRKYYTFFSYPEMDSLNENTLNKDLAILTKITEHVKNENNEDLKIVMVETIKIIKAKINILIALKNNNPDEAFRNIVIAYGDIDKELINIARKCYKDRIKFYSKLRKVSNLEKQLGKITLDAKEIKKYFDLALEEGYLKRSGFKTIISGRVKSIDVRYSEPRHKKSIILIPKRKKVRLLKLYELIAHEIGIHVNTNYYNTKCGLKGLSIGRDWEALNEGMAILNEAEVRMAILMRPDLKIKALPYYVLAMAEVREGHNFQEVFNYIYKLRKKELELLNNGKRVSAKELYSRTIFICRRVFRGFNQSEKKYSGLYFTKDISYLKGEIEAKKMKESGVDIYLLSSKVSPKLIPNLIRLGIYDNLPKYEDKISLAKNVAINLWKKGFENQK